MGLFSLFSNLSNLGPSPCHALAGTVGSIHLHNTISSFPHTQHNTTLLSTMPAKANAKPSGPSYFDLIKAAIVSLAERSGSSRQAIKKHVAAAKKDFKNHVLNSALKQAVKAGKLVQVKGSYKLAAALKKAPKKAATKKPAAKKAATKKPATKKTATKKPATKKAATKKASTKKAAPKKAATKKAAPKKAATKKAVTKKAAPKKKAAAKKAAPKKKAAAKKAAAAEPAKE